MAKPLPYPVPPEPSLMTTIGRVLIAVRRDGALDAALDTYVARHHGADNVRARFLSQRRAYEVTLILDAEPLHEHPRAD